MSPVGVIGNSGITNSNFSSTNRSQNNNPHDSYQQQNNRELIELGDLNEKTWLRIGNK